MQFSVHNTVKNSRARTGSIITAHGTVQTPVFMPLATAGAVKTLTPWEVKDLGAEIILGNTYHLHLRPGEELIAKHGELHHWMNWNGPILTDSGGYQAFSLGRTRAKKAKTTADGVRFYSHLDGQKLTFTPESVIDIQTKIGSDIVMVLDDCAPFPATTKRLEQAVWITADWAKRSTEYWQKNNIGKSTVGESKAIFGIVQGGVDEKLRLKSLDDIQKLPFDGIAIGGVSVGEGKSRMIETVDYVSGILDPSRPHYLMGVGYPEDIVRMIHRGIDMFDCVLPTRLARHGVVWLKDFTALKLRQATYINDTKPLDPQCQCQTCQSFSRSYLRHLLVIEETLALRLLTIHNLHFIFTLIREIQESIVKGNFTTKYRKFL